MRLGTGGIDKRASSLWSQWVATVIQTTWVSSGGNTGLDNGPPVRSLRRDRGLGREMVEQCHGVVPSWH
jgi:hypothetical protein